MMDADIEFEERLYARDDTWPATKEKLIKQGLSRNGQVPSLEYKGHVLTNVNIILDIHLGRRKLTCYAAYSDSALSIPRSRPVRRPD